MEQEEARWQQQLCGVPGREEAKVVELGGVEMEPLAAGGLRTLSSSSEKQEAAAEEARRATASGTAAALQSQRAVAEKAAAEKRVDTEDGVAYTWKELSAYYKGMYKKAAIACYWESLKPVRGTLEVDSAADAGEAQHGGPQT